MAVLGGSVAAELARAVGACEGNLASGLVYGMTVVELQFGLHWLGGYGHLEHTNYIPYARPVQYIRDAPLQ